MRNVETSLPEAIRAHVAPGMHLHFASTPSRSNAAIREVARQFHGRDPRFVVGTSGFHSTAHLLGMLGLGRRYIACFFGDNHPAPRPNPLWEPIRASGATVEVWGLGAYVTALRAGALGHEWGVTRSLVGSDLGADLARGGHFRVMPGTDVGLVTPMRADVAFLHAVLGDARGNAVFSAPFGEGFWAARGARQGVIVTVERLVEDASGFRDAIPVPPDRVLAICHAPGGTLPQPLHVEPRFAFAGIDDDYPGYALWRRMAAEGTHLDAFVREVLGSPDVEAAYRGFVARYSKPLESRENSETDVLVLNAAATIVERVLEKGHRTILAGIGHAYAAARLARRMLVREGIEVEVLVETGLEGIDEAGDGDGFPLSRRTIASSRRLSSIEDVLCSRVCGADNRCLGVIGAAEVDARGCVNSTFSKGKLLVGPGGANDIASCADEVVVVVAARPGKLVDRVEHVTSPGHRVVAVATDRGTLVREDGVWRTADDALRDVCPWLHEDGRRQRRAAEA